MGIILPKQYVEEKALQHEYYDYKEIERKNHNPSKYEPQKKTGKLGTILGNDYGMRAGQANGAKKGLKIGTREGRINGYKKGIKQGALGAGVIAGGIAAYNHFKGSEESFSYTNESDNKAFNKNFQKAVRSSYKSNYDASKRVHIGFGRAIGEKQTLNKGRGIGALGAAGIAGGIAAYNHFKNSNESLSLNEYIERIY